MPPRGTWPRRPVAGATPHLLACLLAVLLHAATASAVPPGRLVVLDAFADPFDQGHFGALFEVDRQAPVTSNATARSSSAALYSASDLEVLDDGGVAIVDRDADPSGLGPDPNMGDGHGAVFLASATDLSITLLSDGADFPAGLPPGTRTAFVDPTGLALAPDGRLLVADIDADPSELGPDAAGFAGHGAIFAVDPVTGSVALVSDGSLSDDGPPPGGAPSWFEDPGAVAVAPDGRAFVLETYGDPAGTGRSGGIFELDLASGRVRLVGATPLFDAPAFLAFSPLLGHVIVADQLARPLGGSGRGALFTVDLEAPDALSAVTVLSADDRFRGLRGLDVGADGSVFVTDTFADPLGLGGLGTVFRHEPSRGLVTIASTGTSYQALASVRIAPPTAPPPTVVRLTPASLDQGQSVTVLVEGTGFAPTPEADLGQGLQVLAVRFNADSQLEMDLEVSGTATPGPRALRVVNPDLQPAVLADAVTVVARPRPTVLACAPGAVIQGESAHLVVTGSLFQAGAMLSCGSGVVVGPATVVDAGRLEADVTADAAALAGPRDVVVTNADGESGTLASGLTVLEPLPPQPMAVSPDQLAPGQRVTVTVAGAYFRGGMTLDFGPDLVMGPTTVTSPSEATCLVQVATGALPGPRTLVATNPDARSGVLADAIVIGDAPALRIAALVVDDASTGGNASSALDPGETVGLDLTVFNGGPPPALGVTARVSVPLPGLGISVLRDVVGFGDIPPRRAARRAGPPFPEVHVEAWVGCGSLLPVDVELATQGRVVARERLVLVVGRVDTWRRKPVVDGVEPGGRRGGAVALADVDRDGVADLVIGAPGESPGGVFSAGRVVVLSGRTDDPLWSRSGTELNGKLGSAVAGIGDVTGDGREDVLVGAPGERGDDGVLYVLSGADGTTVRFLPGPVASRFGSAACAAGDRDLDGVPDLAVGAPADAGGAGLVVLFTASLLELGRLDGLPGDELGASLARLPDVDGDGLDDIVAGAPGAGGSGDVVRWLSTGASPRSPGVDSAARFGAAVAAGGDLDGDGISDILAGAPLASPGGVLEAGRIVALSGQTGASIADWRGAAAGDELGAGVGFLADVDGDGVADMVFGMPGFRSDDGAVEVRSGASGGTVLLRADGAAGGAGRLGACIGSGRDAGGDGLPDFIAGAPREATTLSAVAGRAHAWKSDLRCDPYFDCAPDAVEPNDAPARATVAGYGLVDGLTICRGDVDVFRLAPPPGRRMLVRVLFSHAQGDLDATLHDAGGTLVDASLSLDDDEELGPFGGEPHDVHVVGFEGATNTYALLVLDPDSCPPQAEVLDLRVTKGGAGKVLLRWSASTDPCHETNPTLVGYRVFGAATPVPSGVVGDFPTGTAFADDTASDLEGSTADETHLAPATPGDRYYLVVDVGRAGEDGPVGAYGQ